MFTIWHSGTQLWYPISTPKTSIIPVLLDWRGLCGRVPQGAPNFQKLKCVYGGLDAGLIVLGVVFARGAGEGRV